MASSEQHQVGIKKKMTIGLLVDWIENQYSLNLIFGVEDYLKKQDINLFCFEGGSLNPPHAYESHKNVLYDLVSAESIDGIIILAAPLSHYVDYEQISRFCEHYLPIPTVSIALEFDSIPSVMVDNISGMQELLRHLIQEHKFTRFAFISGPEENQDARQRYEVFKQTLSANNLQLDPELVVSGDFTSDSGVEAIRVLLDQRQGEFEAVIVSSDDMALGVLEELHQRDIKVPDEIAVVGFDNLDISMYSSPPLTTVSQSMYDQGMKAAELLLDWIAGREVAAKVIMPTRLVIRESCGCLSRISLEAAVGQIPAVERSFKQAFALQQQELSKAILQKVNEHEYLARNTDIALQKQLAIFLEALYLSITTIDSKPFLNAWNRLLCYILWTRKDVFCWQAVLSEIRRYILPLISDVKIMRFTEDMFHQVRVMISEKILLEEKFKNHISIQETSTMNYLREELLVTLDEGQLMDILAKRLPEVGIRSCYLSLFTDNKYQATDNSRLILAYNENGRIEVGKRGIVFKSCRLLPDKILPADRRHTMLVVSLSLANDQLGFLIFEMGSRDGMLYGGLRRIICSTLQGALLLRKIRSQTSYLKAQRKRLTRILIDLRKAMSGFIQTMALTVETRDPYTAGHQRRVADLARSMADELNLSQDMSEGIRMAGIIHDLGKIYVPAEILNKPGRLKDIEFNLIKIHPEVAYDILKSIDFPWPIAAIILQHHERLDGSGYPLGLKGDEIMKEARILSVADVVEAMASHRPYRESKGIDQALEEISQFRGIRYDADAVDACLTLFRQRGYVFRK